MIKHTSDDQLRVSDDHLQISLLIAVGRLGSDLEHSVYSGTVSIAYFNVFKFEALDLVNAFIS
ncbi:hypothetical protein CTI12_AA466810 [Artemisia annua]|uniref:Uncharacterized protein n=1 Tax=Artemisia annua TaxID=35608 RepID=A0A2U1LPR4_ARTAN|nr:hypothetical protein CTI12_AA466810 [Artemisia annua]